MTEVSTFEFDLNVCRLSAIKKAAYRYGQSAIVKIQQLSPSLVRVELTALADGKLPVERFPNEVLDQELRKVVAEETSSVRDILLAQAFSNVSLVDPLGEQADWRDDPRNVAGNAESGSCE